MVAGDGEEAEPADAAGEARVTEYGGYQPVDRFRAGLGLPEGFFDRAGGTSLMLDQAVRWLTDLRPRRQNHWPALTLAVVAQAEDGLLRLEQDSIADVFRRLRREETDPSGQPVNTLNFVVPAAGVGDEDYVRLRGKYNLALSLILARMRRNGHPSNPGHATQSWPAYRPLIDLVWAMTPADRRALVEWVWTNGVLPLDETQIVAAVERPVRPFELVLADMPTASSRPGSVWQGLCYGYLRADSPNLQLESSKAQTGSRRSGLLERPMVETGPPAELELIRQHRSASLGSIACPARNQVGTSTVMEATCWLIVSQGTRLDAVADRTLWLEDGRLRALKANRSWSSPMLVLGYKDRPAPRHRMVVGPRRSPAPCRRRSRRSGPMRNALSSRMLTACARSIVAATNTGKALPRKWCNVS